MRTRVELELTRDESVTDRTTNGVSGSVRVDGGRATAFVGWVQLLSLLEQSIQPDDTRRNGAQRI